MCIVSEENFVPFASVIKCTSDKDDIALELNVIMALALQFHEVYRCRAIYGSRYRDRDRYGLEERN